MGRWDEEEAMPAEGNVTGCIILPDLTFYHVSTFLLNSKVNF